jgi:hypothetical protein
MTCPEARFGVCGIGGLPCRKPSLRCPINPLNRPGPKPEERHPVREKREAARRVIRGYQRGWGPVLRPLKEEI